MGDRTEAIREAAASMRPPDLPGGNSRTALFAKSLACRFNEAAGFTRRKPGGGTGKGRADVPAQ